MHHGAVFGMRQCSTGFDELSSSNLVARIPWVTVKPLETCRAARIVRMLRSDEKMPLYRFDFYRGEGDLLATHEIDYENDQAAIEGGHLINGFPSIGCGSRVWRDGQLTHWHHNAPPPRSS